MPQEKKKKQGFTLIEIMVVIAIIGIISGISVAVFSKMRIRAWDNHRIADTRRISLALKLYYDVYKKMPDNFNCTKPLWR